MFWIRNNISLYYQTNKPKFLLFYFYIEICTCMLCKINSIIQMKFYVNSTAYRITTKKIKKVSIKSLFCYRRRIKLKVDTYEANKSLRKFLFTIHVVILHGAIIQQYTPCGRLFLHIILLQFSCCIFNDHFLILKC